MVRKRVPPEQKIKPSGKIAGAPITWTDDLIQVEAEALNDWCQSDSCHKLLDFCHSRDLIYEDIEYLESISPAFSRCLKKAKQRIAQNRENMVNKEQLNYGAYNRYASMYDPMLKKHERAEKAYDAELKRQIVAGATGAINLNITDYSK